jgi:hypothetical protein
MPIGMSFYPTILYPWSPATQFDKDNGQAGMYCNNPMLGNSNVAVTASRAYLTRFRPSRYMTIISIAFAVGTPAAADDACDVGIYDASFNRLVSAGATTGKLNSGGVKNITISTIQLAPSTTYFAAFSVGTLGGSAASVAMTSVVAGAVNELFGTGSQEEQKFMSSGHPLPTTITPGAGAISSCPILAVRET